MARVHKSHPIQADGVEMTVGVNVVAYYVLINKVLPNLQSPGRIIMVDSDIHFGDCKHTFGTIPAPKWPEGNLDQVLNLARAQSIQTLPKPGTEPIPPANSVSNMPSTSSRVGCLISLKS
ncbi:hypothetical protein V1517DRAFT_340474 [Lipomyces orientalis]|uniref:Uncharacterized protein n=1 Tax=Lipomyces orientalis TaxID=1233043 RepID=A0ACC3TIZ0_9ASCO